ncbi:MAG: hypothetical protein LBE16_00425, partial [Clostridiales Family XIII bacterium]|nr:hypothetical protein [Clostridiales Family XIII bacterium]
DPDGPGAGGDATVNQAAFVIIAAKVSGLTITDLRSVAVWAANDTFLYASGQIDSKKFNGHDFPLDVSNEVDHLGYVLAGIDSLDDLATDNVIYIYKHPETKKITRIDVGTESQSGTVTNYNEKDFTSTLGGKVLLWGPYEGIGQSSVKKVGTEGTALLDIYKRIYAFRLGEASRGNFAVLLESANYFGDQAKIFDKTGKEVIYSLKDTITRATNSIIDSKSSVTADNESLFEYKLSGGKLTSVEQSSTLVNVEGLGGAPSEAGEVSKTGSILYVNNIGLSIDSSVIVYVRNGVGDYSLGSIKDLAGVKFKNNFEYIREKTDTGPGNVVALLVNANDAGANDVFVMINSIAEGWSDGPINVVNGLNFADGASAAQKEMPYFNDELVGTLNSTQNNVPGLTASHTASYGTMVKFRIGEDGVLKEATPLDKVTKSVGGGTLTQDTATYSYGKWGNSQSDGSFSIFTTMGAIPQYQAVAFEANTVLYKKVAGSWVAYRPTDGNFKSDTDTNGVLNGQYKFLKTDLEKSYDVIIKIN